ncbi:putative F-box protein At1g67623 [Malania oleifera]|uniref:putative F-box protein At1g67623 n=1 Tax=Malania oleifera TaxID=397392 RepID=UPI0025AE532B|nr:putative F-box protein At1g67623 [Malania oleifera]
MGLAKIMKRKICVPNRTIKSLPEEMLTEVLARVASSSLTDLCNAKLSCRDFLGAADDNYIFEHASMEKFPVAPWPVSEEASSFLRRCKECGNAEALYREGMVEYFSKMGVDSGLEYLKRAAEKGHVEASYVYGIILLCTGGQPNQRSLELLSGITKSLMVKSRKSRTNIRECRRRIQAIIWSIWIKNYIIPPQMPRVDHAKTCMRKGKAWQDCERPMIGTEWEEDREEEGGGDDDEAVGCEACRWYYEVLSFCDMLRAGR